MKNPWAGNLVHRTSPLLSDQELKELGAYIESRFGIQMPAKKRSLLQCRLAKRLLARGLSSYGQYFREILASGPGSDEYERFVDLVSTHETRFFREPEHFKVLSNKIIPALNAGEKGQVTILSAACSSGEEAYSLAMVALAQLCRPVEIHGMDLSSAVLDRARLGVYPAQAGSAIPVDYLHQYCLRSKTKFKNLIKMGPELRAVCQFHPGNLLHESTWPAMVFDIIFCRNVLIYFEPLLQRQVVKNLARYLKPGGILFVGHSETMAVQRDTMNQVSSACYQRR